MQTSLFQSAQRIISQTLSWLTGSTDSAISERISDTYQNGVCYAELNSMAIVGKDIDPTLPTFFTVEVQTGVSYIGGERTAILDSPLITYNAANPSQTTDDGTGNFVPTPQSTGSYAIPLSVGFINYLYIRYLATIDTSAFTLNDITLGKQFYKQTDGYQIVVNTTGINPNSAQYILLGQVDLTGTNQAVSSNISIVNRPYYKTLLNRVGIQTNNSGRTDRPASYAIGLNDYFLDDHIKAIGTGIVSPINAHGLSLTDLGVNPNDTVEFHRIHEHVNGIIAGTNSNPFPIGSAMFVQRVQVTPGDDYIVIQPLITNEVAVVDGVAYTSTQFGSPVTIPFTGNPSGVYNVYFDGTTFNITQSDISGDETKLFLATTTWTPTPGDGNLSLPADRRQLGTLDLLERWVTSGRPANPISGNFGYNIDLNQMEYFNGTTWVQPLAQIVSTENILINGGMEIWQRGTVFNSTSNGAYTSDRWKNTFGGAPTVNVTQESSITHGGTYSMKVVLTSVSGAQSWGVNQVVENYTEYAGQALTLSVWVNTAMPNIQAFLDDGITLFRSATHPGDGAWHQLSVSATMSSAISLLSIGIFQNTTGVTGTLYIDSAMCVLGSQVVNYVPRATGEEISLCQRYYEKSFAINITPANGTTLSGRCVAKNFAASSQDTYYPLQFKVTKRIAPTMTAYTTGSGSSPLTTFDNIGTNGGTFFAPSLGTLQGADGQWTANAEI